MNFSTLFSGTLSWLTLAGQVLTLVLIITLAFSKKDNRLMTLIRRHGMTFAFIVALISTLGSLTYSDILMLQPCKLCWFQRIAMYPEAIILGVGLYIKDRNATLYALVLALIGLPIALYHYLEQVGFVPATCSTVGYSVSCAKIFTMNLGYITIPLMAFTAFLLNILFILIYRDGKRVA